MVVRRLGTIVALAASLGLVGCVTDSASIYIAGAIPIDTESCTFAATTTTYSAGTTVDVAFGQPVQIGFAVQSLVRQRTFAIATDPSTILVDEAEIELSDAAGGSVANGSFTVDVAGAVIPGSADGVTPGQGVVIVPVIPAAAMAGFAGITTPTTIVARITLRGRTNGHIDVEGGPFTWVITLLPPGGRSVMCDPGTAVPCCFAGQDAEFYCSDLTGCAPTQ